MCSAFPSKPNSYHLDLVPDFRGGTQQLQYWSFVEIVFCCPTQLLSLCREHRHSRMDVAIHHGYIHLLQCFALPSLTKFRINRSITLFHLEILEDSIRKFTDGFKMVSGAGSLVVFQYRCHCHSLSPTSTLMVELITVLKSLSDSISRLSTILCNFVVKLPTFNSIAIFSSEVKNSLYIVIVLPHQVEPTSLV